MYLHCITYDDAGGKNSLPLKGPETAEIKIIKKKGLNINKTSSDRNVLHKVKVKLDYIDVMGRS